MIDYPLRLRNIAKAQGHRIDEHDVTFCKLAADRMEMLEAKLVSYASLLSKCGEQFRKYETSHRAKARQYEADAYNGSKSMNSPEDALKKADVNSAFAELCEAAIK